MRLRKKPGMIEKLKAFKEYVFQEPAHRKGKWGYVFGNENPIYLELGIGKGNFVNTLARINPQLNYVGVERVPDIIYHAALRVLEAPQNNLRLVLADVEELPQFFVSGEIQRIYLNFSDPWPKARHTKRRLTHQKYLEIYEYLLVKGGQIHLKTDNLKFFEYSLSSMSNMGFSMGSISYDLHNSGFMGNVMTEYELRFSSLGQPIYRVEAFTPVK